MVIGIDANELIRIDEIIHTVICTFIILQQITNIIIKSNI